MQKMIGQPEGTQKQMVFQTIKQPDSMRREEYESLTTAKAISIKG